MLFRNEFGDVIAWRAALAGTAVVAASAGLAVALFDGVPTAPGTTDAPEAVLWEYEAEKAESGPQEPSQAPTTASGEAPGTREAESSQTETIDWLTGTEGSALWGSLAPEARDALHAAVTEWAGANGTADATSYALESAEATPEATIVRVRAEWSDGAASLEARLAPGGAWQVADVTEAPEAPAANADTTIPIADVASLSRLTGETVAAEVARQVAASGLPGAEGTWTTAETVTRDGTLWRLSLWMPTGEAGPTRYDAAFDEGLGLLEIAPTTEGAL